MELKLNADNKYTFRYDLIDSQDTTLDKEKTQIYELVEAHSKVFGTTTFGGEDLFTEIFISKIEISVKFYWKYRYRQIKLKFYQWK